MEFLKRYFPIVGILVLGAGLRLWGIDFGLPFQFHQDEPIVVNHALAYGTGDFNPHFFIIPPLTSYILFFCYAVYFLLLKICGIIAGQEAFALSFFKDPTPFYCMGRIIIGVIPSLVNIYLTYRLTLSFFTKKAALYAGISMTVMFLNVLNAHYLYTDNLTVLFILLAYNAIAGLLKKPGVKEYILAGIFIGMATATKYNAALTVIPLFLAHSMACRRNAKNIIFDKNLFIFLTVLCAAFFICNPFAALDWRFFLLSITSRIRHGYVGAAHHLRYSMFEGLGMWFTLLGIAGLLVALRTKLKEAIILLSFPLVFYLHLVLASQPFPRYVLVLVPFICIGAGFLLFEYWDARMRQPAVKIIILVSACVVLIPSIHKSFKADMLFSGTDTRMEAKEWIEENIPSSATIALGRAFFSPSLKTTLEQLKEKQSILDRQPELKALKEKKLNLQIKAYEDTGKAYALYHIIEGDENVGQFLDFWPVIKSDVAELRKEKIEYIIFDNMQTSPKIVQLQKEIAARYRPIAFFNPYHEKTEFRRPFDEVETTCLAIKSEELFARKKSGPYLVIYKIQ